MSERILRGIVIHRCETGLTGPEVKAAEGAQGLGYHYFIGPLGHCQQMYADDQTVWHACGWSHTTLGVAVYGNFYTGDRSKHNKVTVEQWQSLVGLCRRLIQTHGPLFIMGHTELAGATKVPGKVCPGSNLDLCALTREVYAKPNCTSDVDNLRAAANAS